MCGFNEDILLSQTDRHCVNFLTVVCKSCGLIRAKKYYRSDDIIDFYKNHYRSKNYDSSYKEKNPIDFFNEQKNILNLDLIYWKDIKSNQLKN